MPTFVGYLFNWLVPFLTSSFILPPPRPSLCPMKSTPVVPSGDSSPVAQTLDSNSSAVGPYSTPLPCVPRLSVAGPGRHSFSTDTRSLPFLRTHGTRFTPRPPSLTLDTSVFGAGYCPLIYLESSRPSRPSGVRDPVDSRDPGNGH